MRMLALNIGSHPPLKVGMGQSVTMTSQVMDDTIFRPNRLILNVKQAGPIDVSRFYTVRGSRTSKRRKGRRASLLTAAQLLKIVGGGKFIPYVTLDDVLIGNSSQFAGPSGIPAEVFGPEAMLGDLAMDPVTSPKEIVLRLTNHDACEVVILAVMFGRGEKRRLGADGLS